MAGTTLVNSWAKVSSAVSTPSGLDEVGLEPLQRRSGGAGDEGADPDQRQTDHQAQHVARREPSA
jgi:hypothetical protein